MSAPLALPRVSIVVVNLDGRDHLEAFLPSVAAQDYPTDALELVLVDNGSADDSLARVQALYPSARVVANQTNEGFARANNQGAREATGALLVLVNNDMRLAPDFVRQLQAAHARQAADVACVGARILDWEGSQADFVAAGMTFDGKGLQLDHGVPADSPAGKGTERELLFACGGAMLVDRAVYLATGGLDEDFFAYYEDVDFGWRLWVLGFRVAFCPQAVAYHRHNGTSRRFDRHRREALLERNALYAMIKNYDDRSLATLLPAALLLATKRLAARSGLERKDWAFAAAAVPAATVPVRPASLPRKVVRVVRSHGPREACRKALASLGHQLVGRFGGAGLSAASDARVPIHPDAYATAVALEDLIDHLPALLAKRREIQAARRRPDGAIMRLFGLPFQAVEGRANYPAVQASLLAALDIPAYFDARVREDAAVPL